RAGGGFRRAPPRQAPKQSHAHPARSGEPPYPGAGPSDRRNELQWEGKCDNPPVRRTPVLVPSGGYTERKSRYGGCGRDWETRRPFVELIGPKENWYRRNRDTA